MSEVGVEVRAGGRAGRAETAAIVAAAAQLMLTEAAAAAGDLVPVVHRSAWRQAGLREAMTEIGDPGEDAFGVER